MAYSSSRLLMLLMVFVVGQHHAHFLVHVKPERHYSLKDLQTQSRSLEMKRVTVVRLSARVLQSEHPTTVCLTHAATLPEASRRDLQPGLSHMESQNTCLRKRLISSPASNSATWSQYAAGYWSWQGWEGIYALPHILSTEVKCWIVQGKWARGKT